MLTEWLKRRLSTREDMPDARRNVSVEDDSQRKRELADIELRALTDAHKLLLMAAAAGTGWLLYLLGPVLTPFLLAGLFAYLGDPIVDRMEQLGLKRTLAVLIVFASLTISGLVLLIFLVPVLQTQLQTLLATVPLALDWLQRLLLPKLVELGLLQGTTLSADALRDIVVSHWQELSGYVTKIITGISVSGHLVLAWLMNLVLVPVLTFYLLRDWDVLVAHIRHLIPRRYEPTVALLAGECNDVLAGFLRGQFLVMMALSVIYAVGLRLLGIDLAFSIGMLAGLVSFVPYLGFAIGIAVAGLAAIVQFHDLTCLLYVVAVFAGAEMVQSFLLSPLLVGERIGLHPVSVIFAVLAGGQLFGFVGVLLGLPVAAMIVVLLRHSREHYLRSELYTP